MASETRLGGRPLLRLPLDPSESPASFGGAAGLLSAGGLARGVSCAVGCCPA
jgi:hypothetical protein